MESVEVYRIKGTDAIEAIRQQVLLEGAGERRNGVKTGAADSLVALITKCVAEANDQVVLWTDDGALGQECQNSDENVVVVASRRDLFQWFGTTPPPGTQIRERLESQIQRDLIEAVGPMSIFPLFDQGYMIERQVYRDLSIPDRERVQVDVEVEEVEGIFIKDLDILDPGAIPRVAVGDLVATARVQMIDWFLSPPDGELVQDSDVGGFVRLRVPISAEFSEDWHLEQYDVQDACQLLPHEEL